jgi:transposase-like protein
MEQKQKANLKQARKNTEPEIRSLLAAYSHQDGTVKEFCKLHDIREWAFYAWKKKYESFNKGSDRQPGFAALQIQESDHAETPEEDALFAEVVDEKGRCIRIFKQVPSSYLQSLLS